MNSAEFALSNVLLMARCSEPIAMLSISATASANADSAVVPVSRFHPEFFSLRTRLAGEFFQKFVTYGKRIAILGDIPAELSKSRALIDFITECNRGRHIWFVKSREELIGRLANA